MLFLCGEEAPAGRGLLGLHSAWPWGAEGLLPTSIMVPAAGPCPVLLQTLSAPSEQIPGTGLVFLPSQTTWTWWSGGSPHGTGFGPCVSGGSRLMLRCEADATSRPPGRVVPSTLFPVWIFLALTSGRWLLLCISGG